MKRAPASIAGRRGSTTTTSGWPTSRTISRAASAAPAPPDDDEAVADPQQPGEALADPVVRVDDEHAEWRRRRGWVGHPSHRRQRPPVVGNGRLDRRAASADGRWPAYVIGRGWTRPRRAGVRLRGDRREHGPGTTTSMVVPLPARDVDGRSDAPMRSARARIPARPRWPCGHQLGSKPLPSSVTRRRTPSRARADVQPDLSRAACLTTLWSASWAIRYRASSTASGRPLGRAALDHDRQADPA